MPAITSTASQIMFLTVGLPIARSEEVYRKRPQVKTPLIGKSTRPKSPSFRQNVKYGLSSVVKYLSTNVSHARLITLVNMSRNWDLSCLRYSMFLKIQPHKNSRYCLASQDWQWRHVFFYKVIRDLISIVYVCINPIHRIGLIHKWPIDSR